jgi:phosphatidylglycerophosphate synthase
MRDAVLRKQKDRLLAPLASSRFATIHPNWISAIALAVGVVAAAAVWQQAYWLGLALWLLNRVLDGLDGVVARVHHKQSDFGGYLDLLLDFVVYLAVPVAFVAAQPTSFNLWAGLALLASFVMNAMSWTTLAAILEKRRRATSDRLTTIEMPTGLVEGAETILLYSLWFLLPAYVGWMFLAMAALVLFTVGQRLWWAYRHL